VSFERLIVFVSPRPLFGPPSALFVSVVLIVTLSVVFALPPPLLQETINKTPTAITVIFIAYFFILVSCILFGITESRRCAVSVILLPTPVSYIFVLSFAAALSVFVES